MKHVMIWSVIFLLCISGCSAIQSVNISGKPALPTVTPPEVSSTYQIGDVTVSSTTIDRVISVEPVTLPNCNGSSDLTVRRSFTQQADRTPTLMDFDSARFSLSINSIIGVINTGLDLDPAESSPLTETYELEMGAASGTSVQYDVQWVLTSRTGVVEFAGDNDVVYVEFTAPQMLRAITQEPHRYPCAESTEENT